MAGRPQMRPLTERLAAAMREKGLDTVRLAQSVGVSKQYIALLVAGERGARTETAEAIAEALGRRVEDLFVGRVLSEESDNTTMTPPDALQRELTEDPFLFFEEVAQLARMKESSLRWLRHKGEGPPFFRMGRRLRCRLSAAKDWLKEYEAAQR